MTPVIRITASSATGRNVSKHSRCSFCSNIIHFLSLTETFQTQSLFTPYLISPSASTPASSVDPPPPTKSPCPDGYISWFLNCYKLVEQPATWDAAQADCMQQGGNLASIDMSYDQAFVAGVVLQGMDAWIGFRRKVLTGEGLDTKPAKTALFTQNLTLKN